MDNFSLNDENFEYFDTSVFQEMTFSWILSLSISYGDIIMMSLSFLLFQEMLSALGPNTDFERMVEHCLERISRQCTQFLLKTENKMKWISLLSNTIYFTEHISKMVHIRYSWRSHTTQHVLTLQKRAIWWTHGVEEMEWK